MQSQTDYLLGADHHLFRNVLVWDAHHNIDQYLLLGCLHRAAETDHSRYLGRRGHFPLQLPRVPIEVNRLFVELRGGVPSQHGGIGPARRVYHQRLGVLSTPVSWRARAWKVRSGAFDHSAARYRQAFRRITAARHMRRGLQLSHFSHPNHILSNRSW